MQLTPLGTSPACPVPGGACSGYLVAEGNTNLLVDCGTGVVSNLRKHLDYRLVSAVVISHLHADHTLDLIPYRYGLVHGPEGLPPKRIPLYVPPGGTGKLLELAAVFYGGQDFYSAVFDVQEYNPEETLTIGPLGLQFHPTPHYVPAYAISVQAAGKRLVFSADTGRTEGLVPFIAGANLFLCEATLPEDAPLEDTTGHLRASDAARMAREAGAKRLMLTHMWGQELAQAAVRAAEAIFGGPVDMAQQDMAYEI